MKLSELIRVLERADARLDFIKIVEENYKTDQQLMPEHEQAVIDGFTKHFELLLDKFSHTQNNLVNNLIPETIENGDTVIDYEGRPILFISVDCKESSNLAKLSRHEIRNVLDKTVYRVHNVIRDHLPRLLKEDGQIILLNRYRGSYDVISYALEAHFGTMYRELRDTAVTISLIDYQTADVEMLASRIHHCLTAESPKFHYCVGVDTYISKLASKILPEDSVSLVQ